MRYLSGKQSLQVEIRSVTNLIDEINTQFRNQFCGKDQNPETSKLFAQLDSFRILYAQSKLFYVSCLYFERKDSVSY